MTEFKRIFVMTGYHNDWLYTQMMPILRARYGVTFYIVAADDRIEEFRARCGEGDTVVSVNVPIPWSFGGSRSTSISKGWEAKFTYPWVPEDDKTKASNKSKAADKLENQAEKAAKQFIKDKDKRERDAGKNALATIKAKQKNGVNRI